MISLVFLTISILIYVIAEKFFSKKEEGITSFQTEGSIFCIVSAFFFILATLTALYSSIDFILNGFE